MKFPRLIKRQAAKVAKGVDPSWASLTSGSVIPYAAPTVEVANSLSAVQACVSAIGGTIASLPVSGTADWIKRPNDAQTWSDFIIYMMRSVLLWGNAIAVVDAGQLIPVEWRSVRVDRLHSKRLRYVISRNSGLYNQIGDQVNKLAHEVVHLRDASDDGIIGVSRLTRCAPVINGVLTLEEAARNVFINGAFPSGVVQFPGTLKGDSLHQAQKTLQNTFGGSANRAKLAVLYGGAEWKPAAFKPSDAEMLDSRTYALQEICRIYDVPPVIIADHSNATYTNAETAIRLFAITTLTRWVKALEQSIEFGTGEAINIDMGGLMRGDPATRWANHKIAIETGVYTPAEIKAMEGEIG